MLTSLAFIAKVKRDATGVGNAYDMNEFVGSDFVFEGSSPAFMISHYFYMYVCIENISRAPIEVLIPAVWYLCGAVASAT